MEPEGVAVSEESGDVYVVDRGNGRVEQFNSDGSAVLGEFNGSAAPSGAFVSPEGIAVDNSRNPLDPSRGNVYVVDAGQGVVDKFSASGVYLSQITTGKGGAALGEVFGVAVDPEGSVFVYAFNGEGAREVNMYTNGLVNELAGSTASPFGASSGFAVDSEDNLYVNRGSRHFAKLAKDGTVLIEELDNEELESTAAAISQETDHVFINDVTSVGEFTSSGELVERFGSEQLTAGRGVAVNAESNQIYATDSATDQVIRFLGPLLPGVHTGQATGLQVSLGAATFSGTVNPRGIPLSSCEFEYGLDTSYGSTAACTELPSGSTTAPVHADVTGLTPGVVYHFRLIAANENGSQAGKDNTVFVPGPAVISGEASSNVTATSAILKALINPEALATSYQFEYGTNTEYGTTTPAVSIGEGLTPVAVEREITGLKPDTTYHWRVSATNADGTTASGDHTFIYSTTGAQLPDNRQYELVTPTSKNGAVIAALFVSNVAAQISEDGNTVMAPSIQCFPNSFPNTQCVGSRVSEGGLYEFSRSASGWHTQSITPEASSSLESATRYIFDPNTHTALFSAQTPAVQQEQFYARQPDRTFTDIGPITETTEETSYGTVEDHRTATADLSHVVYATEQRGHWASFDETAAGSSLYEYLGAGNVAPVLVGVTGGLGSHDLIGTCGTSLGNSLRSVASVYGSLSSDGRVVYFTSSECASGSGTNSGIAVPAKELYARIDQARTVQISSPVSASCKTPECQSAPASGAVFQGAATRGEADGDKVFFTSTQQLTDDASQDSSDNAARAGGCTSTAPGESGCNLYESECPEHCTDPATRQLVDISVGAQSTGGPRVQGVLALSPDGSHVYFVARGVLTTEANLGGESAKDGAENLYLYENDTAHSDGQLTYITALPEADEEAWSEGVGDANITPDGRFLVFGSRGRLTVDATRTDAARQIYRYDAQTKDLVRISIGQHGFNDNGNAATGDAKIAAGSSGFELGSIPGRANPTMSSDGRYVFFESPIGLTPTALNDAPANGANELVRNVYEYHDGEVSLLSDGKDSSPVFRQIGPLIGTDTTGTNVFFWTADQLTSADTDTQFDIYDARICSSSSPCATPPQAAAGECADTACHNQPTAPSSPPIAASTTVTGSGNLSGTHPPTPPRASIISHSLHGTKLWLKIRIPTKGQIRITSPNLHTARRITSTPGTYTLKLTTRRIRRQHHRKLKIKVHLTYTTNTTTQTTTTTINT